MNKIFYFRKIKIAAITTLGSFVFFGIGATTYHIISSDSLNAQQTADITNVKSDIKALDEKIDSTQPAKVAEQIKNLETNQSQFATNQNRLESKIDYNEQVRREQHENLILRQDKMYEILLEIKRNGNPR